MCAEAMLLSLLEPLSITKSILHQGQLHLQYLPTLRTFYTKNRVEQQAEEFGPISTTVFYSGLTSSLIIPASAVLNGFEA